MRIKKSILKAALSLFVLLSACHSFGETVCKVENIGGVPRIVLNGKPVRARMLYVSPLYFPMGSLTQRTAYAGESVETFVEIPPFEISVGSAAVEIQISNEFSCNIYSLKISEIGSGKNVYSLNPKGDDRVKAVGAKLTFENSDADSFLSVKNNTTNVARIIFGGVSFDANRRYRIDIKIRAEKDTVFDMYATVRDKFLEPKPKSFLGIQTKLAKEAEVDFITFPVQAADFMPEDGKSYNTENLKSALDEIIGANPDAKILLRIRCYPPQWWVDKYPEDVFRFSDGKPFQEYKFAASAFSERFRRDTGKALEAIIDFCEKYYEKNIAGYHPGGAHSCEWFYPDTKGDFVGYEESAQISWRKWLTKKYDTDEALRKAWNEPNASLLSARVPLPAERRSAFCIINPQTQQKLYDYNTFRQDAMTDTMLHLSKIIRKKTPHKLSALFYGYVSTVSAPTGASNAGHFGLYKVLESPDVDILCGPLSYSKRDIGFGGMYPSSTESITRSGKIWFVEDDIRTYRVPPTQRKVTPLGKELRTLPDTMKVLQRDMAQSAIRNCGSWYMDLAGTGWFDDPEFWKLLPMFAAMESDMIKNPVPYRPDVAAIFDERSICFGGADSTHLRTMGTSFGIRSDIMDLAAPYGYYLLDDYIFGKAMSPKLAIFGVSCALDAKQRKAIFAKTRECSAMFVWATGLIDVDKKEFSLEAVREATGFAVSRTRDKMNMFAKATPDGKEIGLPQNWGTKKPVEPLLTPKIENGDKVLAVYENGEPAIVLRGKHLFCGMALPPVELYKYMIGISGAHVYSRQPLSVFANGAYISVTCTDGDSNPHDVKLDIPSDKEVFDALTGEKLGKAPNIKLKMKRGDNRVLRLGNGNSD